jgi:hypothetical protein
MQVPGADMSGVGLLEFYAEQQINCLAAADSVSRIDRKRANKKIIKTER